MVIYNQTVRKGRKMKRSSQKQIMVRIDEDTRTKLKVKVIKENTSIQEVLEKAIQEYLNDDKDNKEV